MREILDDCKKINKSVSSQYAPAHHIGEHLGKAGHTLLKCYPDPDEPAKINLLDSLVVSYPTEISKELGGKRLPEHWLHLIQIHTWVFGQLVRQATIAWLEEPVQFFSIQPVG